MAPKLVTQRQVKFIDFTEEIRKSFAAKQSPKKPRTKLDSWQIATLEKAFDDDSHPSMKAKKRLSSTLGLQIKSIQIWFQNKRAKEKSKREQEETDSESSGNAASEEAGVPARGGATWQGPGEGSSMHALGTNALGHSESFAKTDAMFSSADINCLKMSYDDCYSSISSLFDIGTSSFSEYDSFLSSFGSPIVCMPSDRSESDISIDRSSSMLNTF
ncbi:uncharacterized protein NEMAJ01_1337 [Nematocida major]|uniref:uncharacterized protein n=1 Tax=Nematocida major TaxID=1912982 RepID=UPI00200743D6|nr:uncharacterized protein NEMAJ01_1337 [Nematocida major]KAH9386441.1 hypothetical protein NEMAJ01_1337 [Nematocida major]